MRVPFYEPPLAMDRAMRRALEAQAVGHGSHGPEVEEFERAIADYHGVPATHVVCTSSCTDAMAISLLVLRASRVMVPTITWSGTPNAVEQAGCEVVLGRVNHDSVLLDPQPEDLLCVELDTVLGVHLYGQRWEPSEEMATKQVVVDAAHAFELPLLEDSDATCFSFHTLKSIPVGVGGASVFRSEHHAREARAVRFQGVASMGSSRVQSFQGWKATMPAFAAAMGLELMQTVDARCKRRKQILERYMSVDAWRIAGDPLRMLSGCAHAAAAYVDDPVRVAAELRREGIDTARYYPALQSHPYWQRRNEGAFPEDVALGESLLALPLHAELADEQVDHVIASAR